MPLGNQSVEGLPVFGLDFCGVLKAFEHHIYKDHLPEDLGHPGSSPCSVSAVCCH